MNRRWGAALASVAIAAALAGAGEALGCPSCATGRAARAAVFGPGFWLQALLVALPFLLVGAISVFLYRIGRLKEASPWRRDHIGER